MTAITFDTLKFAKRLKAAGFTEEQAEAFAEVQRESMSEIMDSSLATKGDIFAFKSESKESIQQVKDRIIIVESEIKLLK